MKAGSGEDCGGRHYSSSVLIPPQRKNSCEKNILISLQYLFLLGCGGVMFTHGTSESLPASIFVTPSRQPHDLIELSLCPQRPSTHCQAQSAGAA